MTLKTFSIGMSISFIFLMGGDRVARAKALVLEPSQSSIEIHGGSSLHDWTLYAQAISGSAQLSEGNNTNDFFTVLYIVFPVSGLASKSSLMTSKAQKALSAKKYTQISFTLASSELIRAKEGGASIKGEGLLRVAGVNQSVKFKGLIEREGDGIQLKGKLKINMKNFKVDPPSYLFVKVGPEVEGQYRLVFKPVRRKK